MGEVACAVVLVVIVVLLRRREPYIFRIPPRGGERVLDSAWVVHTLKGKGP